MRSRRRLKQEWESIFHSSRSPHCLACVCVDRRCAGISSSSTMFEARKIWMEEKNFSSDFSERRWNWRQKLLQFMNENNLMHEQKFLWKKLSVFLVLKNRTAWSGHWEHEFGFSVKRAELWSQLGDEMKEASKLVENYSNRTPFLTKYRWEPVEVFISQWAEAEMN